MGIARAPLGTLALAAALLAACGDQVGTADAGTDLEGSWHLLRGTDATGALDLPRGREITLKVDGTQAAGTSGCNLYGGRVRVDGSALRLSNLAGTEMACETAVMDLEQRYLAALQAVERGRRTDATLELSGPHVTLRFELDERVEQAELVDTVWVLESLVDGDTVSTPASGGELRFLDGGVLVGTITCGPLRGRYSLDGASVMVTELRDRDRATGRCPDDVEAQHSHVVDVLRGGFTAEVDGRTLTLTNDDGLGLVFHARGRDGAE
jgi:heat shock protein HslJ